MSIAPDMGRAYQELGHLNRDMGNEEKAVVHYRQACELNPALLAAWNSLYKYFVKNQNKPAADRLRIVAQKSNVAVASQVLITHFICSLNG